MHLEENVWQLSNRKKWPDVSAIECTRAGQSCAWATLFFFPFLLSMKSRCTRSTTADTFTYPPRSIDTVVAPRDESISSSLHRRANTTRNTHGVYTGIKYVGPVNADVTYVPVLSAQENRFLDDMDFHR